MKKLLIVLIAFTGLTLTTQAQTEEGNWTLGGNASVSTQKTDGSKSSLDWSVVPTIGYFVAHNIEIGTGIGYISNKYYINQGLAADGSDIQSSVKNTRFTISPYARVYKNITDGFKFFGQFSVPLSFGTDKIGDANGENYVKTGNNHSYGVALSPGLAFFPSKRFGIEFSVNGISYSNNRSNSADGINSSTTKAFDFGANFFAPTIGIRFYL